MNPNSQTKRQERLYWKNWLIKHISESKNFLTAIICPQAITKLRFCRIYGTIPLKKEPRANQKTPFISKWLCIKKDCIRPRIKLLTTVLLAAFLEIALLKPLKNSRKNTPMKYWRKPGKWKRPAVSSARKL